MSDRELEAWEPEEPPAGFAERVTLAARAEVGSTSRLRSRRIGVATIAAFAAAAAVAVFLRSPKELPSGDRAVTERTEVAMGARAVAVLEPGAHVSWKGARVTQDEGNVFYRVERGDAFEVHTPAGDVTVHGTSFRVKVSRQKNEETAMLAGAMKRDVKSGAIGAALSAIAFVGVYEGRVAVSHAQDSVHLGAGESAEVDSTGVRKTGDLAAGEKAFAAKSDDSDDPTMAANRNLAESVRDYKNRLGAIESEKKNLEQQLTVAQEKLAAVDGAAPIKNRFDLAPNDWAELAKEGTVKYRVPCSQSQEWKPKPETLTKLGVSPGDVATLRDAYAKSNVRVWAQVKPLCIQAVGSAELAEKLGTSNCTHVIFTVAQGLDREAANEAQRIVGEIRAGLRPMPGPNDQVNPVERLFLALTGENKVFEGDLTQSVGPDEAHRLAFADGLCAQTSEFGGPGPRARSAASAK